MKAEQHMSYRVAIAPALCAIFGMGLCLALTPALTSAATAAGPLQQAESAGPVTVIANGSVPDIAEKDLPAYVAATLNASHLGQWHFEAAHPGPLAPGYCIAWSFKQNAYAAGTVRTYGFSRGQMARLIGSRNSIAIEGRLFLNGEYQTLALAHVTMAEGGRSTGLAETMAKLTRELMAYPALDTKPDAPAQHGS